MSHFSGFPGSASLGNNHLSLQQQQQQQQQQPQQQLAPISGLQARPYQQDSPGSLQILPPLHTQTPSTLHSQTGVFRHIPSAPHTPRTPHTPGTPILNAGNGTNNLSQLAHQSSMAGIPTTTAYAPVMPTYSSAQSLASHTSMSMPNGGVDATSMAYSHIPSGQMPLPQISPGMFGTHSRQSSMSSYSTVQTSPQDMTSDSRLMPVVGSQGRRGILPSVHGRAAPPPGSALDGSTRGGVAPQKNAEGKYPCLYCTKTYLHLKHLKRHHLRHTGERPYQCCLCQETFCRSDILKRHFAKCSLRRGNPTGATHLTHAQAHLRPTQSAPNPLSMIHNGSSMSAPINPPSNLRTSWGSNGTHAPNLYPDQSHLTNGYPLDSTRSSRSSSILRPGSSSSEEKKRYSNGSAIGPGQSGMESGATHSSTMERSDPYSLTRDRLPGQSYQSSSTSSYFTPVTGSVAAAPLPMVTSAEQTIYGRGNAAYSQYPTTTNGQMNNEEWASYFQPGAQDSLMFSSH